MRFRNVSEPTGFAKAVAPSIKIIDDELAKHGTAAFTGPEAWTKFKVDMAPATFGKCGYCEVNVVAVDRFKGDVEHYRPKGRVDRLVINPDGSVKLEALFSSGYPWLAYSWTNYILTCNPCNSAHKRNFFPLATEPTSAPMKGDEASEDALLLNPFGRKDPTKHLVFDHLGVVGPRRGSKYGAATIGVCGLSRSPLEKKRRAIAELVKRHLDVLGNPAASTDAIKLALETLADLGGKDKEHCGMVRGMFTETSGLPWSYVEQQAPRPEPVWA